MSAETEIAQIIDEAISSAQDAQQEAVGYTDQAQTAAASSITSLPTVSDIDEIDLDIPLFINPTEDLSQDFKTQLDLATADLEADFASQINSFLNNWFPDLTSCIKTNVYSWLCTAIAGGTGLDPTVEAQLWQRGRDREAKATSQQRSTLIDEFAGRGWDLGSEYLADLERGVVDAGRRETSEMNRNMTIEFAKIRIETAKFAIQTAAALRIQIMQALNDYLRTFFIIPAEARQQADAYVDAKRKLWEGASAYYSALVNAKDLLLKGQMSNQAKDMEVGKWSVEALLAVIKGRVEAAVAAADTMGQIAAASRGAINSLAHIGNITNEEG